MTPTPPPPQTTPSPKKPPLFTCASAPARMARRLCARLGREERRRERVAKSLGSGFFEVSLYSLEPRLCTPFFSWHSKANTPPLRPRARVFGVPIVSAVFSSLGKKLVLLWEETMSGFTTLHSRSMARWGAMDPKWGGTIYRWDPWWVQSEGGSGPGHGSELGWYYI